MDDTSEKWDARAGRYQESFENGVSDYNRRLLDFLDARCGLGAGLRVLDIGCGVGKYGAMLLRRGCVVTLTDISPEMLRLARINLAAEGENWRTITGDFAAVPEAELTAGGKFGLSMSTMSPGVRDAETVAKMSRVTGGLCFLARFHSWDAPLEREFMRAMGLPEKPGKRDLAADCADMERFVREAGYEPETTLADYDWADRRSSAECAARFCDRYFDGEAGEDMKKAALAAAENMAGEDGTVLDEVRTKAAWIWWRTE